MTNNEKENKIKTSEVGTVFIKKEAFRNMLSHVLRFGSDEIESVEVMGVCLGKKDPNTKVLTVMNAIPITHGAEVSQGFSDKHYSLFSKISEQHSKMGLKIIGWYISHPQWGVFFSDVSIKNHRYFQKETNPHAFCIVFDYSLMSAEDDLGFEVYRLADHTDLLSQEYVKVASEVEVPNTLEYFKWVQKFVEDTQKKNPVIIKEIEELIEPKMEDLQEIPGSKESSADANKGEFMF
ncbi:MAG: hypothetical protein GF353_21115, partial [Candidatus Lokiarchaeota archaeon]|nr:hypothetical protein [Candidatus Lokiarchaeota archaeon]